MVYIVKEGEFELIRVRKKQLPAEKRQGDDTSTRGLIGPKSAVAMKNSNIL